MLQDIAKNTPEHHKDYSLIQKAIGLIKQVADYINMIQGESERSAKMFDLSQHITGKVPKGVLYRSFN